MLMLWDSSKVKSNSPRKWQVSNTRCFVGNYEKQLIDLKDLRGKYVLLSFWASYDAPSRVQNATLNHAIEQADNVEMVSVSFDEFKSIFNETIKKDRISTSNCFVELAGNSSDLFKTYRLNKGFKNFLLDKNGVIVAKDITPSQLSSYLN